MLLSQVMASLPSAQDGLAMTVRGGGVPLSPMAAMPALRMGPPSRSFAADAHACIMVWVTDPPDTRLRRECLVPRQRASLGRVIPTTTSVPPCSGLPSVRINPGTEEEM
jgi:hypothetical protein